MAYTVPIDIEIKPKGGGEVPSTLKYDVRASTPLNNGRAPFEDIIDKKLPLSPGWNLVVISAFGEYSGLIAREVESYVDPSIAELAVNPKSNTYTGQQIKPTITVKIAGTEIRSSYPAKRVHFPTDDNVKYFHDFPEYGCYRLDYSSNVNVGTATCEVVPLHVGDGVASKTIQFSIVPYQITGSKVKVTGKSLVPYYEGQPVTQNSLVLKFNGTSMALDSDYRISYADNDHVGQAKCILLGIGNFSSTLTIDYTIYGDIQDVIAKDSSTGEPIEGKEYDYTGIDIKPEPIVQFYEFPQLVKGTEYSVAYPGSDYTSPGSKTVSIIGKQDAYYKNTKNITYSVIGNLDGIQLIGGKDIYDWTGSAVIPELQLKLDSIALVKDRDYTISYPSSDYTSKGMKTLTYTGKGFYKGDKQFSYVIYDGSQTIVERKNGITTVLDINSELTRQKLGISHDIDTEVTRIVIGSSISTLQKNLLANCQELVEVDASHCSIDVEIPEGCFIGCTKLVSVVFPQSTGYVDAQSIH